MVQEATLVYENQVPNIAVLLLKGSAYLKSSEQNDEVIISKPCLICFWQLIEKQVSRADITLSSGTDFSFLDLRGAHELTQFACIETEIPKT